MLKSFWAILVYADFGRGETLTCTKEQNDRPTKEDIKEAIDAYWAEHFKRGMGGFIPRVHATVEQRYIKGGEE